MFNKTKSNFRRANNSLIGVVHKLREQVRGEGGVSKMFTLVYNPYLVNWFTRGEGGVKTGQNLVHVVCERPLTYMKCIQTAEKEI